MSWVRSTLQKAAVWFHLFMLAPCRFIITGIMIYWLFYCSVFYKFLVIAYALYFYWDYETPFLRGRRWGSATSHSAYISYLADYFSLKVVETAELPRDRNYLGCCHPHALFFFSWWLALGADVTNFRERTKIELFLCTLNVNFMLPIAREYFLTHGIISVSEKTIKPLLSKPDGGNMVCIVLGGANEAEYSSPRKYHFLLRKRRGFCRIALETGSSLVPIISFGEVDCWEVLEHNWLGLWIQHFYKKYVGMNYLVYKQPGSKYKFGLPKKTPITVVGAPIHVEKKINPTEEEINQVQEQYIEGLQKLFEQEKHKYIENADEVNLVIL